MSRIAAPARPMRNGCGPIRLQIIDDDPDIRYTRWPDRCVEVEAWARRHGRWPSQGGLDRTERSFGQWISRQRANANKGALPDAQLDALAAMSERLGLDWRTNRQPKPAN